MWVLSIILITIGLLSIFSAFLFAFSFNVEAMGIGQIIFIIGLLFFIVGILFYVGSSISIIKEYKNKRSAIVKTFIGGPIIIFFSLYIIMTLLTDTLFSLNR